MKNAVLILFAVFQLGAQQPPPPAVLRIFREDIKEGKNAAHENTEAAFMQAVAKANYPAHVLGLTSITGTSQAVFLEGHASIASIADSQAVIDKPEFVALDAADAELRTSQRSVIAVYRPDLSFGADKTNPPKVRFFSIETLRVREGQGSKFAEAAKTLVAAAAKSGDTQPVATYEVVSGAPGGTYLLLEPMASLKALDEEPRRRQALRQALTSGDAERDMAAAIANQESILFAVNPQMSYVPREWIAADPDFWTPKPVTTAKVVPKTTSPKTSSPKSRKKAASQ